MKDKQSIFIGIVGIIYFALYTYLFNNMSAWILDLTHCYSIMKFNTYFKDHLHIMLFVILFFIMSFFILKMLYTGFREIFKIFTLNNYINLLKYKNYKNLIVINTKEKLAFNFFNKIVISNSILNQFSKEEKKSVFLHEKGHLFNKDGYKLLISNLILSLFPSFISSKIERLYIVNIEANADKYASKFIDKLQIAKTLLKLKTSQSYHPMMNNFTEDRLKMLLEGKEVKIPKTIHILIFTMLGLLFLSIIYKTCLCGIM